MGYAPAAKKLTAVTPFGTFTRKTAHGYTHIVVRVGTVPSVLEDRHNASVKWLKSEIKRYQRGVEDPTTLGTTIDVKNGGRCYWDVETIQGWVDSSKAGLEYEEQDHPTRMAANAEVIRLGMGELVGWSGSLKNAMKAAQNSKGTGADTVYVFDLSRINEGAVATL